MDNCFLVKMFQFPMCPQTWNTVPLLKYYLKITQSVLITLCVPYFTFLNTEILNVNVVFFRSLNVLLNLDFMFSRMSL